MVLNTKERTEITNKLKKVRKEKGFTQAQLSKIVGISETHYQNIEYGLTNPSIEIVLLLMEALSIDNVRDLFPLPSDKTSPSKNNLHENNNTKEKN